MLALHNEISNNLTSLETSLKEKRTILEVNKELLENTFPGSNWKSESKLDSLMYYFTVSGWIYVADNGVLNEIVNSGKLSSLGDNNIKNLISYSWWKTVESCVFLISSKELLKNKYFVIFGITTER